MKTAGTVAGTAAFALAVVALLPPSSAAFQHAQLPRKNSRPTAPFATSGLFTSRNADNAVFARDSRRQNRPPSVPYSSSSSSTALAVSPAVVTGAVSGGLFAGGLHAIAGPDHLAALLPKCVGQRWYNAGRIGALWGMGHGVSATLLGILAFGLKAQVQKAPGLKSFLAGASHITEIAVGLSLIVIGVMGIREAREWEDDEANGMAATEKNASTKSLSAAANMNAHQSVVKISTKRAVVLNGLLHGFSWDGAPSLAPALALATWGGNLTFLSSYAAGTMATMALATTLIGEGTRRAGQVFQRPDIPQKLSFFSSFLAIAIGVVWCGLAFK